MDFLRKYNIEIKDKNLLTLAFTHSSYSNEHKKVLNYERLEFLGDAVLELIISEYYFLNTSYKEGDMTKLRASYVCEPALAFFAKNIGLEANIIVGHGQEKNINDTIIADVFESVLAVIYLDQGYNTAKRFVYETVIPYIKEEKSFLRDYKTILQELVQTGKKSLEYVLVGEYGKSPNKMFTVEVRIDNIVYGRGTGKNKKEAEQKAAFEAFEKSAK